VDSKLTGTAILKTDVVLPKYEFSETFPYPQGDPAHHISQHEMLIYYITKHNSCQYFSIKKEADSTLSESNFLKKDGNYYAILKTEWRYISRQIADNFSELE
jgi:hypothetical protein